MATVEHCLLCFEALDAALNKTEAMSLDELRASWAVYNSSTAPPAAFSPKDPVLQRVAAADVDSSSSSASSSSSPSLGASTPATTASSSLTPASVTSAPLFVTWNTLDSAASPDGDDDDDDDDDVSLRGCIGTFESQPLAEGLPEYALISALQDTRFPPVAAAELPALQVAVTLLTDFEEAADALDWEVGRHGIRLSFRDAAGRRYGATYLPDIAAEQGWTKEETLFSLARKAGWTGSRARWPELALKVTRYQGKKRSLNYAEYRKWKDWAAVQQKA